MGWGGVGEGVRTKGCLREEVKWWTTIPVCVRTSNSVRAVQLPGHNPGHELFPDSLDRLRPDTSLMLRALFCLNSIDRDVH